MQSCSPLKAQTQTGIHLFLFKVIFALPRRRQTQKSHAVYITTSLLVFHWHIFPPPFPRAHSSEAKGREKTAELSLFCWEWFRRALGSGDTTFWCWKEERHFWEEKAGRKSSICSAPSCCCDRAGFKLHICPWLSLPQAVRSAQRVKTQLYGGAGWNQGSSDTPVEAAMAGQADPALSKWGILG